MHLGIHLRDYAGFYPYGAIIDRCPLVDTTLLYDPEARRDEGREKLLSLGVDDTLLLDESEESDFVRALEEMLHEKKGTVWDDNVALLARTVGDGLFQRDYVLQLMAEYMDRTEGDILLGIPGFSYRKEEFQNMALASGRKVWDPLQRILPQNEGEGRRSYRWIQRDFDLERWAAEIIGERPLFQKMYYHPLLHQSIEQLQGLKRSLKELKKESSTS